MNIEQDQEKLAQQCLDTLLQLTSGLPHMLSSQTAIARLIEARMWVFIALTDSKLHKQRQEQSVESQSMQPKPIV